MSGRATLTIPLLERIVFNGHLMFTMRNNCFFVMGAVGGNFTYVWIDYPARGFIYEVRFAIVLHRCGVTMG